MAATVVCNYETAGFSRHGPKPQSVFMNGRVHHYRSGVAHPFLMLKALFLTLP
jgi:hypothetical protein